MDHPKSALNAYCQKMGLAKPSYETKNVGGDKEPLYIADVVVGDEVVATGQGPTKREAERIAAELALEALKQKYGEPKSKGRSRRKKKAANNPPANNEGDNGPWPVFPELLAESLRIAHQRVPQGVKGPEAAEQVVRLASEIYKGLIEEIGVQA